MKRNYKFIKMLPVAVLLFIVQLAFGQIEVVNTPVVEQTGEFTAEFDVVPSHAPMNGGVGLANTEVGTWGDMACIVGFHPNGLIRAYNSTGYEYENEIMYVAGTSYHIVMVIDVDAQTYNVTVTPDGGSPTVLATDYGFRVAVTELNMFVSLNDENETWGGVPGATLEVSNLNLPQPYIINTAKVYTAETLPVIDGDISDWDGIEAHALEYDANDAGHTPEDFSAYWKAVWSDTMFYAMAVIHDDTLWNEGSAFWNHDAVNFYFGFDNERDGTGASNGDHKYLFYHWWGHDNDFLGGITGLPGAQVSKFDLPDGSGWAIEWKASFNSMDAHHSGTTYEEGTKLMFDVVAVDDDDATDPFLVYGWAPDAGGMNFSNMDHAGEIELAGAPPVDYAQAQVYSVETAPEIDGDISDWDGIEAHALDYDANGANHTPEDFSAYWKAVWKDTMFYAMAVIHDDTLWNEGSAFWNHDAVNFYFGFDNERDGTGASNGDHKYLFYHWWGHDDDFLGGITGLPGAEVSKFDLPDGSGWAIEWKASFNSMDANGSGTVYEPGTKLMFDVVAVDDDDATDPFLVYGWSPDAGGGNFGNMDNAGEIELANPPFDPTSATIYTVTTAPVIDGDFSDWDAVPANELSFDANGAGSTPEDFSGYWKAVWKDTMLYVMAEIKDDTLWNEGSAFWNHDAVNFYFGFDNERDGTGASNGDHKYLFYHWWGHDDDFLGGITGLPGAEVHKVNLADGSGWAIEWKASFNSMDANGSGTVYEEGTKFIFDVVAVDDDDATDPYIVRGWADDSGAASWTNMDHAGEVELGGALPVTYPTTKVYTVPNVPVIDGDISDWDDVEAHALDYDASGAGHTPEDYSAYWKAVWSDTMFYAMAVIHDDTLYNEGSAFWNHDAINFYFGFDNQRDGTGASNGDHKYLFYHWWGHDDDFLGGITGLPGAEVSKFDLPDGSGWAIEWKASFNSMDANGSGTVYEPGTKLMFDVVGVDDDDALDPFLVYGWAPDAGGGNFGNMDNAGEIELALGDFFDFAKTTVAGTNDAPVIDGDFSDWDDVESHSMDYVAGDVVTTEADFSGYWKAEWDFNNMYLMVDINDDTLYNEGSAFWNHDAVNFYFGLDNDRNGEGSSNGTHKYLFYHWWGFDADHMGGTDEMTGVEVSKIDKADGSGWAIEWKIPWTELDANNFGLVAEEGTKFMFDVVAVDDDDATDPFVIRGWAHDAGGTSFSNMDFAGEVELVNPPTDINDINAPAFKVYPNPVSHELVITDIDHAQHVVLYNLTGQQVKTVKLTGSETSVKMDMSGLVKGMYILTVTTENGRSSLKIVKE